MLNATYWDASESPEYRGFQWGKTQGDLSADLQSDDPAGSTSDTFSALLTGLESNTLYYYRAYIAVLEGGEYKYYTGEIKSFTTAKPDEGEVIDPGEGGEGGEGGDSSKGGWFELPAMNVRLTSDGYMVDASNSDLYYAIHKADVGTRNYTVCYKGFYHCPVWVAAPRHSIYSAKVVDRSDAYRKDPNIPSGVQQASTSGSTSGYNRGHMLGSAERLGSRKLNEQVFYITNIAPQNSSWFNTGGGGWNILEEFVDRFECPDTLYVVIGTYFENYTDGYGNRATKKSADFMGSDVQIPTAFYYAMMRTKSGSSGKSLKNCSAGEIQCAAFIRAHAQGTKGQQVTKKEMLTIDKLEELTGFDYFPNVPNAPESSMNPSDWGL